MEGLAALHALDVRLKKMKHLLFALLVICAPFACLADEAKVPPVFPAGTFDEFVFRGQSLNFEFAFRACSFSP